MLEVTFNVSELLPLDEYRQYIEKDGALARRFQVVMINATSIDDTIEILNNIKDRYEHHHLVRYSDESVKACVMLSDRYISDRFLPDKAIDLMDEAGAKVHINNISVSSNHIELRKRIEYIRQEKRKVIRDQLFEKAAEIRDREKPLLSKLRVARTKWEAESDDENISCL